MMAPLMPHTRLSSRVLFWKTDYFLCNAVHLLLITILINYTYYMVLTVDENVLSTYPCLAVRWGAVLP